MGTPHAPGTTSAIAFQKSDLFLPWGATRLSARARALTAAMELDRARTHFLKLIHVAIRQDRYEAL